MSSQVTVSISATLLQGCARHRKKSTEDTLLLLKAATRWHLEKHRINPWAAAEHGFKLLEIVDCKDTLIQCLIHILP